MYGAGGWRGWWSVGLADISVSSSLPAVHGIKWTCSNGNSSSGFSVEQLVQQILDSHQTKPPPRTHNCLCTGTLGKGLVRGIQFVLKRGLEIQPEKQKDHKDTVCYMVDQTGWLGYCR